jgi:hypothetical protein
MNEVSPAQREVASAAADAFGGNRAVQRFYDNDESHWVDMLICRDRPVIGLTTYSTVTLHETLNELDGAVVPVEVAGVASSCHESYPRILASAAFCVLKDGWLAAPGVVFQSRIDHELSPLLDHILWAAPFPWPQLGSVTIDNGL